MNIFLNLFSKNIKSVYSCYDRVIARGYILWMFSPANLICFLRKQGFNKHSNGVMRVFTDQLNAHVEKEAKRINVPIIWWASEFNGQEKGKQRKKGGRNGDKLEYVETYYAAKSKHRGDHVFCIIADMESEFSYATREQISKKGAPYEKMYECRKIVKHYYIYFHDRLLGGPCYLKISTYFPFQAEFYFNGHNVIRLALDKKGIAYRKDGNAFTDIADTKELHKIIYALEGKQVQQRIDYWMARFFKFDKGKYSTRPAALKHDWFCSQVEVCTNIIFKSAEFCTSLFNRLLDKFSRIGQPDSLSQIFGKRTTRKNTKSTRRPYENKACLKYWFIRNSIKFYNKLGYYLRIETTINNPKSLGLKKSVINLREYLAYGKNCNQRLLNCFADVDVKTIASGEMEKLNQPVVTKSGHKIAAPDLRKARQVALFTELLKPIYAVHGFRTRTLLKNLPNFYQKLPEIRYEIQKLTARGWIEKKNGQSFYMVTNLGYQILWAKTAWNLHFEAPMISATCKDSAPQFPSAPSNLESAYKQINNGLALVAQELCLKSAA
jgi:hypothetical protein